MIYYYFFFIFNEEMREEIWENLRALKLVERFKKKKFKKRVSETSVVINVGCRKSIKKKIL